MGFSLGVNCICKSTWKIPLTNANSLSGFTAQPLRSPRSSMGCKHLEAAASSPKLPPCRRLYLNIQFLPLLVGVSFFSLPKRKLNPSARCSFPVPAPGFPVELLGAAGKAAHRGESLRILGCFLRVYFLFLTPFLKKKKKKKMGGIMEYSNWSNPSPLLASLHCLGNLRPVTRKGITFFHQLKKKKSLCFAGMS